MAARLFGSLLFTMSDAIWSKNRLPMSGRAVERPRIETDEAAVSHCYRFLVPPASTCVSPNEPISQIIAAALSLPSPQTRAQGTDALNSPKWEWKLTLCLLQQHNFPTHQLLEVYLCIAASHNSKSEAYPHKFAACHEPFEIANSSIYS